jgi:hypothetical protein
VPPRSPAPQSRRLLIAGIVALVLSLLDPLEGSILVLTGTAVIAFAALRAHSRWRRLAGIAFVLVLTGVAALWGFSALGGIGGTSGRSIWWGLLFLPYPMGWIAGMVAAIRLLREPASVEAALAS